MLTDILAPKELNVLVDLGQTHKPFLCNPGLVGFHEVPLELPVLITLMGLAVVVDVPGGVLDHCHGALIWRMEKN